MAIVLYIIVAFTALGAILGIAQIGKRREPITPALAVGCVVYNAFVVAALLVAAGRLS